MSKKFNNVDSYDASVDQLWKMLADQTYWEQKYASMGATDLSWKTFNADDETLTISSVRSVSANLPGFAKKVVGETAEVTQTEEWSRTGDSLRCSIKIVTKGAPGGTNGSMSIEASGQGTTGSSDFDIKISIPMLGGKLEKIMFEQTGENFQEEKKFNDEWLASH